MTKITSHFLCSHGAFSKTTTYHKAASRTFPSQHNKFYHPSNKHSPSKSERPFINLHTNITNHNQTAMLSSIFISALLAGPVAAGVIARQSTVTVKHTITSVATSTVFASYAPSSKPAAHSCSPSSSTSALPSKVPNAMMAEFGLNLINGLPAAPPPRPKSVTKVPAPSTKPSSSAVTTPLVFRTYTPSKGVLAPTATNTPHSSKSSAPSSPPALTRSPIIQSPSAAPSSAPSSYSPLLRAPPHLTTSTSTSTLTSVKTSTLTPTSASTSAAPTPTDTEKIEEPSSEPEPEPSSSEKPNPYPYPTKQPKKPKVSTPFSYPYPTA